MSCRSRASTRPFTADTRRWPIATPFRKQLYQDGVRRYGFHGLSYEYITRTLPTVAPEIAGGRLVVAHLGSGASMCAIRDGRSIDSTMGFTALDGLPMGTRPGQLDAGVILHLLTNKGMTADAVQHLLYHDCGLKGLSGISNDVRDLLASDDPRAKLALDYFVYRAGLALGSLAASLEGLDAVVFTAGIGENAPAIRAAICQRARWLGIELDEAANAAVNATGARLISTGASRVGVYVIPTDEERMIAHHTLEILRSSSAAEQSAELVPGRISTPCHGRRERRSSSASCFWDASSRRLRPPRRPSSAPLGFR